MFKYDSMTNELWEQFQQKSHQLSSSLTEVAASALTINQLWHQIQSTVLIAANTNIPFTFRFQKQFQSFSPTASKTHTALNICGSILQTLTNLKHTPDNNNSTITVIINSINQKIQTIQLLTNLSIAPLTMTNINSNQLPATINIIKNYRKTLYHTHDLENKQAISQQIEQHIQTHYNNFTSNTTTMINSIINHHTEPVLFDNIKL